MTKHLTGRRGLMTLLTVLLLAAWSVTLRPASLGGRATYVIVDGTSMEPTYHNGDLVIARSHASYGNGDVIAYYPSTAATSRAALTIHRIIGQDTNGAYLTQGDNRPEPDQWVAPPENVEGSAWLHAPGVGSRILWLRDPQHFAVMVAGFVGFSVVGRRGARGKSRHRRGGNMHDGMHDKRISDLHMPRLPQLPVSGWTVGAVSGLMIAFVLIASVAVSSYRQPTETTRTEVHERYSQTAAFDYSIQMERSILYPEGTVGPIAPLMVNGEYQNEASTAVEGNDEVTEDVSIAGTPIFTNLAKTMDLGFNYDFASDLPHEINGQYSAVVEILAGEGGWTVTEELVPQTAFDGTNLTFRVPLDFSAITAKIAAIEEETGFTPNEYTISVIPTVMLQGTVGQEELAETYSPPFTIELTDVQLLPIAGLVQSDVASEQETVVETNTTTIFGLTMSVSRARTVSTIGLVVVLLAGIAVAFATYARLRRDENSLIKVRYRPMLISVADADLEADNVQRVRLASMQDLARLAQRDGQIIFQQELGPEGQRYFVRHGDVVYEYSAGQPEFVTTISRN